MLKIKTYTAQDSWGGTGLFAAQDIAAGTPLWVYNPAYTKFISPEEYFAASEKVRAELDRYTYPIHDPQAGLNGLFMNLDDSKYMNHSEEPNTASSAHDFDVEIAVRAIKKGEELTCNYFDFDPENMLYAMGVYSCKKFLIDHATFNKRKSAGDR